MTLLIVLACLGFYGFMAGLTYALCDRIWKVTKRDFGSNDGAVFLGIIWPIGLFAAYAMHKVKQFAAQIDEQERVRSR